MFRLPSRAGTVLLVGKVVRVVIDRQVLTAYRLVGTRLRAATLAEGAVILPWPARSVGRPRSRAAEPPPQRTVRRSSSGRRSNGERKRITQQRRELAADPANALVDPVRRQNATVISSQWRDPADNNVLRKTPKTVSGFRADDPVRPAASQPDHEPRPSVAARRLRWISSEANFSRKVASTSHAGAAVASIRNGSGQIRSYGARALPGCTKSTRPSVRFRLRHRHRRRGAQSSRSTAPDQSGVGVGRLLRVADCPANSLRGSHAKPEEKSPATIGAQLGEPSAPPAAVRWAAD